LTRDNFFLNSKKFKKKLKLKKKFKKFKKSKNWHVTSHLTLLLYH